MIGIFSASRTELHRVFATTARSAQNAPAYSNLTAEGCWSRASLDAASPKSEKILQYAWLGDFRDDVFVPEGGPQLFDIGGGREFRFDNCLSKDRAAGRDSMARAHPRMFKTLSLAFY
ncbi:MAG: hypothetical protein OXC26_19615 [Albidovulum sp.]|nr:hypothetical protein [Albidovulum sp.]